MSFRTIIIAVCFSALFLTASDAVQAQRTGFTPKIPTQRFLGRYGLERAWWGQATLNPTRDTVRHLTVDEENVYVQATSGVVTAFDNETGKRLWAVQDRKSTRLNSSHVVISYAGFCLHKKKQTYH